MHEDRLLKVLESVAHSFERIAHAMSHSGRDTAERLYRIEVMLGKVLNMEVTQMAIQQDIIDAVTAETTAIDGFVAYVRSLVASSTITAEAGQKILADMQANRAKLDPALLANVPVVPTQPGA